jgi:hypothetical protein
VIFSSNIIKTCESLRDGAHIKKKEKEEIHTSLQIKGEVNILKGEKHFNFKNPFCCDSIFSPSIKPFKKLFTKSFRNFS